MVNMIRAKFKVNSVTSYEGGNDEVKLSACTVGEENKNWSKFTPSGSLTITITNPAAQGKLKPGKSYYIDFTEAE